MSAELSRDVVGHVARLARIALDDHELDHFADHLGRILDHASELEALDLDDVEPMSHPYPLSNVLRSDTAGATLDPAVVLAQAPARADGQFSVPPVLGEAP